MRQVDSSNLAYIPRKAMLTNIELVPNVDDSLGKQIFELSRIDQAIKACGRDCTLDFRNAKFLHPTTIVGISALIEKFAAMGVSVSPINIAADAQQYLNLVSFPKGMWPDYITDWSAALESYQGKNYLPIICFPTLRTKDATTFRDNVLSKVNELIAKRLNVRISEVGHISYFISELTDNIVEHSDAKRGKIMVQYYPNKEYLEICILDDGKSILGAYRDSGRFDVANSQQAIDFALKGNSVKSKERGYGIPTSTNLIVNGLQGKLFIVSGDAILVNNTITAFPVEWKGTMLSIKIPKVQPVNWREFI